MKPVERIRRVMEKRDIDRPALSLWKHVPIIDRDPDRFFALTCQHQKAWEWDFLKLCYNGLFSVEDWGSVIRWPEKEDEVGEVIEFGIKEPLDWTGLKPLDPKEGALGRELYYTSLVVSEFKNQVPVIGTVFSPLTTAIKMCGDNLFSHMKEHPDLVLAGLETITATTRAFVRELGRLGVDGIFFATQMATRDRLSWKDYSTFGKPYDLEVLSEITKSMWFNILHIHGLEPMFEELIDYPMEAVNWHDRRVSVTLSKARRMTDKVLIGGIDEWEVLHTADEDELRAHVKDALDQVGDTGIVIGPGCVVPLHIPEERFGMLRRVVSSLLSSGTPDDHGTTFLFEG